MPIKRLADLGRHYRGGWGVNATSQKRIAIPQEFLAPQQYALVVIPPSLFALLLEILALPRKIGSIL